MHSRYSVWRMSEVERVETMHDECGCSELQDIAGLGMDERMGWTDGWLAAEAAAADHAAYTDML